MMMVTREKSKIAKGFVLKSDNPAYDPVKVSTVDEIRICGKVIGQITDEEAVK
ncbi:MAG: hypothetical protein WA705_17045 [Candidatus Ozemobacteraceae bacterium]